MIWRRFLLAGLIFFNIFLLYNFVWSDNGIFAYLELQNRHAELKQQLDAIHDKSLDLSQEIRRLKSDRPFIEKMARARMNYLKNNEILYQFPSEAQPDQPGEGSGADGKQD